MSYPRWCNTDTSLGTFGPYATEMSLSVRRAYYNLHNKKDSSLGRTMFDEWGAPSKARLMTIGYEGADIADFIATLKVANVTTLIDVRELPLSRKKGFSKNKLREQLELADIDYLHVKQLGDPKPGRMAARAGNMKEFRRIFGDHIQQDASREALQSVLPVIQSGGACLLCFERCHSDCHRSIVADELAKLADFELAHIGVRQGIAKQH